MFRPNKNIKVLKHQDENCTDSFNIMCWNVAKLTLKKSYKEYLNSIIKDEKIDILLLQEVKKQLVKELYIYDFSYIFSPNIQTRRHMFGVLSAFKISCENELSLLTTNRELFYATHKVSLITKHKVSHDKVLLIVNLHAVNFVTSSSFKKELQDILLNVKTHKGAMIVAGDFNTWNLKRIKALQEFTDGLGLKEVVFDKTSKNLKNFLSHSLDYVFYRGLELTKSKVIDSKKISDHNPIIASFKLTKISP